MTEEQISQKQELVHGLTSLLNFLQNEQAKFYISIAAVVLRPLPNDTCDTSILVTTGGHDGYNAVANVFNNRSYEERKELLEGFAQVASNTLSTRDAIVKNMSVFKPKYPDIAQRPIDNKDF